MAAVLPAAALLAACSQGAGTGDPRLAADTILRQEGPLSHAEIWIGNSTEAEEEPIEVGDQVRVEATAVLRAAEGPVAAGAGDARILWISRDPAVAAVDSLGRVTAVSPGRATIVAGLDPRSVPSAINLHGDSTYVRVVPPDPARAAMRFTALSASRAELGLANCALDARGAVLCWGYALHDDGEEASTGFRHIPAPEPLAALTQGASHACGLTRDGRALCWGESRWGALGTGSTRQTRAPAAVAPELRFVQLSAGRQHTCGATDDGALYCWGGNLAGQLGTRGPDRCTFPMSHNHRTRLHRGECSTRPVRVPLDRPVRAVAAGDNHTCALDGEGSAWCWGDNYNHQVPRRGPRPARVDTDQRFTALWAGGSHTCALTPQGQAYCWGRNWRGQLGTGNANASRTPVRVPIPARVASLAPGEEHTCALVDDGRAWCWGDDFNAQLGTGLAKTGVRAPTPVARGLRFRQLAAGRSHTCGVTLAGGVFCWGSGLDFDLPGATLNDRPEPVRIAGPPS